MTLWNFLFGDDRRARAQRDQWKPSVIAKNLISPVNNYGTCLRCNGTGKIEFWCRVCDGSGIYTRECRVCTGTGEFVLPLKPCSRCAGTGSRDSHPCGACRGSGQYTPELRQPCRQCSGSGKHQTACRRC